MSTHPFLRTFSSPYLLFKDLGKVKVHCTRLLAATSLDFFSPCKSLLVPCRSFQYLDHDCITPPCSKAKLPLLTVPPAPPQLGPSLLDLAHPRYNQVGSLASQVHIKPFTSCVGERPHHTGACKWDVLGGLNSPLFSLDYCRTFMSLKQCLNLRWGHW